MRAGDISTVASIIVADAAAMRALVALRSLALPDAWLAAGFVRNRVWDDLSGIAPTRRIGDIDVVYFDPADPDGLYEAEHEARLQALLSDTEWQVRNQVRMHLRNRDAPYRDTADAIAHFLETPTAVAARLDDGDRIELLAPHGLDDLLSLVCRPTPAGRAKMAQYRARVLGKRWQVLWPRLTIDGI